MKNLLFLLLIIFFSCAKEEMETTVINLESPVGIQNVIGQIHDDKLETNLTGVTDYENTFFSMSEEGEGAKLVFRAVDKVEFRLDKNPILLARFGKVSSMEIDDEEIIFNMTSSFIDHWQVDNEILFSFELEIKQ